ncbi:hypothetical protein BHE74_00011205 [Ensete ventricosum]|nr:hypothetical protein BHE74_00011205 [Ensete ventricosum]
MVRAEEAARLDRLESQVENGGGGAWEYLCLARKLQARRSDKVLKHGLTILNDPKARSKLGGEGWLNSLIWLFFRVRTRGRVSFSINEIDLMRIRSVLLRSSRTY